MCVLSRGECIYIGSTTLAEFNRIHQPEAALLAWMVPRSDQLRVMDEDDRVIDGRPCRRGDTQGVTAQHFQDAPCSILKRRDSGNRPF